MHDGIPCKNIFHFLIIYSFADVIGWLNAHIVNSRDDLRCPDDLPFTLGALQGTEHCMLRGAGVHAGSRRVAICAESSGCLRMLTVAQVAKEIAGFEGMGAHRLKGELRGHQPARGSALRFSDPIIRK